MKNFSFNIFNIIFVFSIVFVIVLILLPFNLINLEQAQRIATWKATYDKLNYSFELVNLHEGSIIPTFIEVGSIYTDEDFVNRISPYLNLIADKQIKPYKYRRMNGRSVKKDSLIYFDKFVENKDGVLLSFKSEDEKNIQEESPLANTVRKYYMFVDINGKEKPNRIGQDIFFVTINKNNISALGTGRTSTQLKRGCSPIGNGIYCSEYYLLGGQI